MHTAAANGEGEPCRLAHWRTSVALTGPALPAPRGRAAAAHWRLWHAGRAFWVAPRPSAHAARFARPQRRAGLCGSLLPSHIHFRILALREHMEGRRLLRVQQGIARATRCDRRTTRQAANAAARPAQPGAVHVDGHMCAPRHHKHDKLHKHTSEPHTAGFCSRLRGCARAPHLAPRRAGPAGEHVRPQVADERSAPARQPARGQRLAKTLIYPDRRPCPPRRPPAPATPCHGRPLPAGALPSSDPGPPPPRRRAHGRPPPRRASQRSRPLRQSPSLRARPGRRRSCWSRQRAGVARDAWQPLRRSPRRAPHRASQRAPPAPGVARARPAAAAAAAGRRRRRRGGRQPRRAAARARPPRRQGPRGQSRRACTTRPTPAPAPAQTVE